MSESEPKKSTSTVAPNRALQALARLLGRQSARQFLAEMEMQDSAALVNPARNASRSSDTTTKAT
jgi:hypothetical protein